MGQPPSNTTGESQYRRILGVNFFTGDASEAVEIGVRGGLVLVPAAPLLLELERDRECRQALLEADLVITDSGFMVLLWRLLTGERIHRVSGLEYLKLLLARPELKEPRSVIWVMPSEASSKRNLAWLQSQGCPVETADCHVAPKYPRGPISDEKLIDLVNERRPRHVIICVGGGVQEKLGHYLKCRAAEPPAIHCIGAAIGFLSGDQVRIPMWADQWILGWLFRCAANPRRFVPRYFSALRLAIVLWHYRSQMPDLAN